MTISRGLVGAVMTLAWAMSARGQSVALSVSTGSTAPGGVLALSVSLAATSASPSSVEFTVNYSTTDFSGITLSAGAAATTANKALSCSTSAGKAVCVVWGSNETAIQSGVIASIQLGVSPTTIDTSSSILLTAVSSASTTGNTITTTSAGSTVAIVQPTLSGFSCTPGQVTPTAAPNCTVTLTSAAPAGISISLGSNSSNLVVNSSVTVPALSSTASFTPTTTAVASNTSVTITAKYASATLTANVTLLPPCSYTLSPTTRLFTSGGGSTTVAVTAGTGCSWTATTPYSWITLQSGGVSGNGNGSFTYSVTTNTSEARLGQISVGGESFKVMEEGSTSVQPFNDVPPSDPYFDYVSLMASNGITAGCSTSPPDYCPSTAVTRAQMSVFIVTGLDLDLNWTLTYPTTQVFTDVVPSGTADSIYFPFVQRIYQLGITVGCNSSPMEFCPDESITQGQMAVFMITSWMQANNLSTFTYTTTPYFSDVVSTDPFFKFIQKMKDLGIWSGCGNGQYCESAAVTRDQMAPMIMRAILGAP